MNENLVRVQIYLESQSLSFLDAIAAKLNVSRSQIIRDAVNAVARRYADTATYVKPKREEKNPLLELAGIEKSKTGDLGLRVDEIYHNDRA